MEVSNSRVEARARQREYARHSRPQAQAGGPQLACQKGHGAVFLPLGGDKTTPASGRCWHLSREARVASLNLREGQGASSRPPRGTVAKLEASWQAARLGSGA